MTGNPDESDDYDDLCVALGHLILGFGNLEQSLSIVLKWHLRDAMVISKPDLAASLSSAVYGSMRFKAARDTIKRILAAENASPQLVSFLSDAFAHAGHLEELRDKLAHQAVVPPNESHSGAWEVWDIFTTRDTNNRKAWAFSADSVAKAAHDTHQLVLRISAFLDGQRSNFSFRLFENLSVEPIPWRYKPSMLALLPRSSCRDPQEQPPPPQSSEA